MHVLRLHFDFVQVLLQVILPGIRLEVRDYLVSVQEIDERLAYRVFDDRIQRDLGIVVEDSDALDVSFQQISDLRFGLRLLIPEN